MAGTEPFRFYTEHRLIQLLGLRASNLTELHQLLQNVPGACIFYHTHHLFLSHHFEKPVVYNDFANWVDEEDIRRQEAEESWLTAMVRDSELAACILGCAVTRWVRARQLKSDELLALEVEAAIGAHRRHRDEDRAARLATLEADLRSRPSPQLEGARARLEALAGPRLYEERKSVFSP